MAPIYRYGDRHTKPYRSVFGSGQLCLGSGPFRRLTLSPGYDTVA
jgi:hypothetical protein